MISLLLLHDFGTKLYSQFAVRDNLQQTDGMQRPTVQTASLTQGKQWL